MLVSNKPTFFSFVLIANWDDKVGKNVRDDLVLMWMTLDIHIFESKLAVKL